MKTPVKKEELGAPPSIQVHPVKVDGHTVLVQAVGKKLWLDKALKEYLDEQAKSMYLKLWSEFHKTHKCDQCQYVNDIESHKRMEFWAEHNNKVLFKV